MTIRRLTASADNTITNAYKSNLSERGTSANMGESDILETFSIYAQANTSSIEKSRILIRFPINELKTLQDSGDVPTSGVKYYLKLYNARHNQSTPEKYYLNIKPVLKSWDEGYGLDMESYTNEGESNWLKATDTVSWDSQGGDFFDDNTTSGLTMLNSYVTGASDDFEKEITTYVTEWLRDENETSTSATVDLTFGSENFVADSTIKITSSDAQSKIYQFVPSQSAFDGVSQIDSAGNIEVKLGTNSIKINSSTANQFITSPTRSITIADGTKTVTFTAKAALTGGVHKQTATSYEWLAATNNANTLASQLYASINNALSNSDLDVTIVDPGGTTDTIIVDPKSGKSSKITKTADSENRYSLVDETVTTMTNLKTAIEATTGHNGKITGTINSSVLKLTQAEKGIPGNTSIIKADIADTVITVANNAFTGGTGLKNNGVGLYMSGSYEDGTFKRSYYTKKFFARGTEFFFKRPVIEIRWDAVLKDDRNNLTTASPFKTNAENTHTVYYHNYVDGVLSDLNSNVFDAGDNTKNLYFSLTTDKALTQKVTISPAQNHVTVSDPLNSDHTKNAFVDIQLSNASLYDDNGYYQSLIKVFHTDPVTSTETAFYFLARPDWWNAPHVGTFENNIYPMSSANTAANRSSGAAAIVEDMNSLAGFSDLFVATVSPITSLNGEAVRIYAKEAGSAGSNGSVTIHRLSNSGDNSFLKFVSPAGTANFDASSDSDSLITRTAAAWQTYAGTLNTDHFAAGYVSTSIPADSHARTRKLTGHSTGIASNIAATKVAGTTGIYKADFKIASNISTNILYEKWWVTKDVTGTTVAEEEGIISGHSGNAKVSVSQWNTVATPDTSYVSSRYLVKINNLKSSYNNSENVRFRVFARNKTQNQNIYTVASSVLSSTPLKKAYFQLKRVSDNLIIIPYSTGSLNYSGLSCDKEGNYFDLDMSLLQKDRMYEISFLCDDNGKLHELDDKFKFRVD